MDNRLYPNLRPFYDSNKLEFGSQTVTNDAKECKTSDHNRLRSENKVSQQMEESSLEQPMSVPSDPMTPSAPPLTLTDEGRSTLLHTLQSYILESLSPPPYSFNDPLCEDGPSWEDDLTPDYDPSIDYDNDSDTHDLSELTEAIGEHFNNSQGFPDQVVHRGNSNNSGDDDNTNNEITNRGASEFVVVRRSGNTIMDKSATEESKDSDKNKEFSAWVTWRKNVNRQLATVILLRQGGRVHLQTADLSRRPLSRSSMNYVINTTKNNNGRTAGRSSSFSTSLSGRPFIMYGIPRVSLSTQHRQQPLKQK